MLDRIRTPGARWQRDYRRRIRNGAKLAEVPAAMVEFLLASKWLRPDEVDDKGALRDAMEAFAKDANKNR